MVQWKVVEQCQNAKIQQSTLLRHSNSSNDPIQHIANVTLFTTLFFSLRVHRNLSKQWHWELLKATVLNWEPCQLLSPNATESAIMYNLYVSFPHHSHHARTSLWSGWWLLCFGTGRKRRMERFLTRLAVQRLPLSSQAWGLARSMRWSWRWWRTTSVDRLPPRMSSQVSVHIDNADRLIDLLFETCWNGFIPEWWICSQFAPGSDLTFYTF